MYIDKRQYTEIKLRLILRLGEIFIGEISNVFESVCVWSVSGCAVCDCGCGCGW